jgi:hypothetical protein
MVMESTKERFINRDEFSIKCGTHEMEEEDEEYLTKIEMI